jgi:hypothetical protein
MPMCYNTAAISSPIVAGLLANLAGQYPDTFGQISFFRRFPYAPPAIASALVVLTAWLLAFFTLKEVSILPVCLFLSCSIWLMIVALS